MSARKYIRQISGFSLVELLVVVAIILLIAALAMPRFLDAQKAAYEAGVVSLLRTLQSDQESYRLGNGSYADNFTDLGLVGRGPTRPENFFTPTDETPLATLLPELGTFRVYAAPPQEPPAKTPPGDPQFGGRPKKREGKNPGAPGTTGMEGGSGGGTGQGGQGGSGGAAGGAGGKAPGKRGGAGGGTPLGGGPPGGGTGGPPPGKGAGGGARGAGGGLGGPLGATTKLNVLVKHNYIFTLQRPTPTTWTCTAAPVRDRINSKFFFMDQTGVMRVESGKAAGANSPQMDSKTR